MPWTLVLISFYSVPLNLYRSEMFWMTLGVMGAVYMTKQAIEATAIDFPESEQQWRELDEKYAQMGYDLKKLSTGRILFEGWGERIKRKFNNRRGKSQ